MEKTIEQEFIEQFDIFKDLFNEGILYLKKKDASKIYVLEDDINSAVTKFFIRVYEFTEDETERRKYNEIKYIIEGIKDPEKHLIQKISYYELNPSYPFAIYDAFKKLK